MAVQFLTLAGNTDICATALIKTLNNGCKDSRALYPDALSKTKQIRV